MTNEEHRARAMLMGRVYDPDTNAYAHIDWEELDIDADTLEVMSLEETLARIKYFSQHRKDPLI